MGQNLRQDIQNIQQMNHSTRHLWLSWLPFYKWHSSEAWLGSSWLAELIDENFDLETQLPDDQMPPLKSETCVE